MKRSDKTSPSSHFSFTLSVQKNQIFLLLNLHVLSSHWADFFTMKFLQHHFRYISPATTCIINCFIDSMLYRILQHWLYPTTLFSSRLNGKLTVILLWFTNDKVLVHIIDDWNGFYISLVIHRAYQYHWLSDLHCESTFSSKFRFIVIAASVTCICNAITFWWLLQCSKRYPF